MAMGRPKKDSEQASQTLIDKVESLILKGYNTSQIVKMTKISRAEVKAITSDFLGIIGQKYNISYNYAKGLKLEELSIIKSKYWEQYETFAKEKDTLNGKKLLESLVRLIVEEAKIYGLYSLSEQLKATDEIDAETLMAFFAWRDMERKKNK